MSQCPFCDFAQRPQLADAALVIGFGVAYPGLPGDGIVVPRWHVETMSDCTPEPKSTLVRESA